MKNLVVEKFNMKDIKNIWSFENVYYSEDMSVRDWQIVFLLVLMPLFNIFIFVKYLIVIKTNTKLRVFLEAYFKSVIGIIVLCFLFSFVKFALNYFFNKYI